jgi:DNA-binding NarL/FixJ family response regulator
MYRMALVDAHPLFRAGLRALLEEAGDLKVVAELSSARAALLLPAEQEIDLFIVGLELPDRDGVALIAELTQAGQRCLALSMHADADHTARALAAGARGYAVKCDPPATVLEAIRAIASGRTWISASLAAHQGGQERGGLSALSRREREIFELVVRGRSGPEIARTLFISPKTVESHRYKINRKLGVRSVAQLIRFAALAGIPFN